MSYNLGVSSEALEWGFYGTASDDLTTTEVPPGTYSITLTAAVNFGSNIQQMTHTISITFVDPCLTTVPTGAWGGATLVYYGITDSAFSDNAIMTDSVSTSHGNGGG